MGEVQIPKVILEAMQEQLAMLQQTVNKQVEHLRQKDERISELEQMLVNAQRARFGQQSEKRKYVLESGAEQLSMFDKDEQTRPETSNQDETPEDTGEIEVAAHTRKRRRTHEEMFGDLPVEEVTEDLPEEEKVNANGVPLVCVGREYIRTELEIERVKANNLRLEDYIEHLVTVLPERLSDDPDADIDDLLPWADAMQKKFAMIRTGD